MSVMVLLASKDGSKVVTTACPKCGRISRQLLKDEYKGAPIAEFRISHTCPVCGTTFASSSSTERAKYSGSYARYISQGEQSYNADIKTAYDTTDNHTAESQPTQQITVPPKMSNGFDAQLTANTKAANDTVPPPKHSIERQTIQNAVAIPKMTPVPDSGHSNEVVLKRKVEHWKKQLLDLSKRNKMINYRETKRTTLKILEPEFTELFNRLAVSEEELTFQRPIDKDSDLRTFSMLSLLETLSYPIPVHVGDIKTEGSLLERRIALNNLRSKSKLARDEQGTNILYLSFGFIEWRENNSANAQWLKSPVLMMPVSLKLESIQAPYTLLRYDDDIEVNPTLDYLFNERYGIDLPMFELNGEESVEQYMQTIEELADQHGWKLIREVSLGLLSFLKISMYHDLNNNYKRMFKNPVIRAITGDSNAANNIPSELTELDFDRVSPNECYQVVNSDSSQQEAILLSKAGVSFVMQGPPGTGKSQTITNIIAEALADGKTILFVSEKAAALQVVYKRLTEAGLDDFCLALHSHKANKKEILDSIAANLKLPRKRMKDSVMFELTELFQDRQALNQYVNELHEEILPLEKSLYDVFGELSCLQDVPYIQFDIESPASISSTTYNTMLYRAENYAKALQRLGVKLSENPWNGTIVKMVTQRFKDDLAQNSDGLAEFLFVLDESFSEVITSFSLNESCTWAGAKRTTVLFDVIERTPLFPYKLAKSTERAVLLDKSKMRQQEKKEYLNALNSVLLHFNESVFAESLSTWLDNVRQAVAQMKSIDKQLQIMDNKILEKADSLQTFFSGVICQLNAISAAYDKGIALIPVALTDSPHDIDSLAELLHTIVNSPKVIRGWFADGGTQNAQLALPTAKMHTCTLNDAKTQIASQWDNNAILSSARKHKQVAHIIVEELHSILDAFARSIEIFPLVDSSNASFETATTMFKYATELFNSQKVIRQWFVETTFEKAKQLLPLASVHATELYSLEGWFVQKFWGNRTIDIDADATIYLNTANSYRQVTDRIVEGLSSILNAFEHSIKIFPLVDSNNSTFDAVNTMFKCTAELLNSPKVIHQWFNNETFVKAMQMLPLASCHSKKLFSLEEWLIQQSWDNTALNIDAEAMLYRFKTEYTSFFRVFKSSYRTDIKTIRGVSKKVGIKLSVGDIAELLQAIIDIKAEKNWFAVNRIALTECFGELFIGENSNWEAIGRGLSYAESIRVLFAQATVPEKVIAIICDKQQYTDDLSELMRLLPTLSESNTNAVKEHITSISANYSGNIRESLLSKFVRMEQVCRVLIELFSKQSELTFFELDTLEKLISSLTEADKFGIAFEGIDSRLIINMLNKLCAEKKWFAESQMGFAESFGELFIGEKSNWEAIDKGLSYADGVRALFTQGNVPEKVIDIICNKQLHANDLSELAKLLPILSEGNTNITKERITTIIENCPGDIRESLLPQFIRIEEVCNELIEILTIQNQSSLFELGLLDILITNLTEANKLGVTFEGTDITLILNILIKLCEEEKWLAANQSMLATNFDHLYSGESTDWNAINEGISFAEQIRSAFGQTSLPESVVGLLCDKAAHEKGYSELSNVLSVLSKETLEVVYTDISKVILDYSGQGIKEQLLPSFTLLHEQSSKLISLIAEMSAHAVQEIPNGSLIEKVSEACKVYETRIMLEKTYSDYKELFGSRIAGLETDWDSIISDLESVSALFAMDKSSQMTESFISQFCEDADVRAKISAAKADLQYRVAECENGYTAFKNLFESSADFDNVKIRVVADRVLDCLDNIMILDNWISCVEMRNSCNELGLNDFTEKVEQYDNTLENVVDIFKRGFFTLWVQSIIGSKKMVEQFRRHSHDEKIRRFVSLDERQLLIAQERIRQNVISRIPDTNRVLSANDELRTLQREIGKKRKIMPLRKLFKSIPNLLLKLKPCMMMSPLSVAYFLEAESYEFEMVIFDEASQIFPQDAVGSIFRGKQVIIAGDSKQLPPTNFFATSTSNDDDDFDEEDDESVGTEIYDSILEETTSVLPNQTLLWHYRSKHENLIAFSNQEIYRNELVTFPSSMNNGADTGVEFVFVENGVYEGKGRNTAEARRCVELVRQHIEKTPNRSLGIIAFSESQQKTIALEIQKFREQHPEYENFFTEDKEDEFFVKNLENVQGDERDTIIFSVSYARTKEQRDNNRSMALRFGPLGQKGGERRLNVAITRAKCNVKLVSSILPSDIDLSRTESEGVKMLRQYIEFAMNGSSSLRTGQSESEKDVFLDVVAKFLMSHGYKIKKYLGCSGYKIDIAILHPDNDDCFVAGIECDGFSYAEAKNARDRDHLRKSVLEAMGWRIYRVWSPEWIARQDLEGQKLLTFIDNAIKEYKEVKKAEVPEQTTTQAQTESFAEVIDEGSATDTSSLITSIDTNSSNPYGFVEYTETVWHETPRLMQYFGDDRVAEEIKYIVGIEQPIYIDLLYQRMAGAFGNQKATAPVRNAVERVLKGNKLKSLVVKDKDGFVTLAGFQGLQARIPADGYSPRQINFISLDEIGMAMLTIAEQAIGLTSEGLIDATAKALGYARKGERMMACMNNALERLIKRGCVKLVDGKVRVIGGDNRG